MNTVRKLLQTNSQEIKEKLDQAYTSIAFFQNNRALEDAKAKMTQHILEVTILLDQFKPYIPEYKQRYFDIVMNHKQLGLSTRDLIMSFDQMVFELHTRLEKNLSNHQELQAWSPLMREILDVRRQITGNSVKHESDASQFVTSGLSVVSGCVKAHVAIIEDMEDLKNIHSGCIIASRMTTPDFMIAIHKISGIITEQGGRLCHAAILAREYNIPCIVGCGTFINQLTENEVLILDADNGIVLK
ncbi:PEP-utilizing enzyme [Cellulosilyticum lentocellum]|uniref:PEP-utilizing protein mobile region n=1 Tax=Cellulosilyticum lentocellum (strain ATCC 49066 / DSM 5427 / NCIMB 11756 / RHM5) TaxID=642492 RepID=F2JSZ1_CELLD|nr:PEP-utilizing enzyme [Cellulosilyticum lentocellum]ADZ84112.1 PEP-utilizing protein mobile region [Cellulosilyticum lentocellum DSM 5427]